jgi:tetratricopeptide (TPR) repeat protein
VAEALPELEAAGDDFALLVAYKARGQVANIEGRMDAALEDYERAFRHALAAGVGDRLVGWRGTFRLEGTTPVPDVLAWVDENLELEPWSPRLHQRRAELLAMLGHFDEARTILAAASAQSVERAEKRLLASHRWAAARVELWAESAAEAVEAAVEACRLFEEMDDIGTLSSAAGVLGQALYAAEHLEEADRWALRARDLGASDDALTEMYWRQVRAKVLGRRGEHDDAEALAREAVAIGDATDFLDGTGDAYADLAEGRLLGGKPDEAAAALEQALERYERKGNLVMAGRAQERLAALAAA